MTNSDTHPLTAVDSSSGAPSPGISRGQVVRTLLWTVLVISVVANAVASFADAGTSVHLACGVVTAISGGILVVSAVRRRR